MSAYGEIIRELTACVASRTPLVILDTEERDRAQTALCEVARALNTEIDFYTECDQFTELRRGERTADAGGEPLGYIEEVLKKKTGSVFALGDVRYLDADTSFSRKLKNIVRLASERKSTVIAVTHEAVWQSLGRLGMYLKLDLPSQPERENIIKEFVRKNRIKNFEADIPLASTVLSGYTALQLNTILRYASCLEGGLTFANLNYIAMRKDRLFGKVVSITRTETGNVRSAGLEGLKEWLDRKKKIFFAPREELEKKRLSPPKGILLAGVPGCGKSLSAKLIADKWQLPLYRFDIGALFDKYVGESEKNMRIALEYAESVSPCVLWIDEIEKELYSGGDNDTAKRLLGSFLYWLQEYSGRVFLVATANDVSLMPPELFRKGRLSEIFYVDLPSEEERLSAIKLYCGMCLSFTPDEKQFNELARISDGFSYADIESAVKTSAEREYTDGITESYSSLKKSFEATVGIAFSQPEQIERSRRWGSERAVPASGGRS